MLSGAPLLFVVQSPSQNAQERRNLKSRAAVHAALNSQERRRRALGENEVTVLKPDTRRVPKTIGSYSNEDQPHREHAGVPNPSAPNTAKISCPRCSNGGSSPADTYTINSTTCRCSITRGPTASSAADNSARYITRLRPTDYPGWAQVDYADMQFFMQGLSIRLQPTSDSAFFNVVIPCLTQNDLGIRELALAIGATQRRATTRDPCSRINVHAIRRSNKAIRHFLGLDQMVPNEVLQASSMLLACLHIVQLDVKTASVYIKAAQKLCRMNEEERENRRFVWARVVANPHAVRTYPQSTFGDIIASTVAKAATELQGSCVDISATSLRAEGALRWTSPILHRPINDRYDLLGSIENLMPVIQKTKSNLAYDAIIDPSSQFAYDLTARLGMIDAFIRSLRSWNFPSVSASGILLTNNTWPSIILRCQILAGSEMVYDDEINGFDNILNGPEFEMEPGGLMANPAFVSYPFVGIIVRPCFFTAVHCRDPHIRRRAINLLQARRRNESGMDSSVAALVAFALMDIEEKGRTIEKAADITESDRVLLWGFNYDTVTKNYYLLYTPALPASDGTRRTLHHSLDIPADPLGIIPLRDPALMLELLRTLHRYVGQATNEAAPNGSIVPIFYEGERVEIQWLNQSGHDAECQASTETSL